MSAIATYDFQGKTILITGGAGEIGKATAHRFAANGATIALLDINEMRLAEVAQGLKDYGNPVYTVRCDVTDAQEVTEMFAIAVEQVGQLDYVFNNAGYQGAFAKTDEYPEEDFEKVIDINVIGVFHILKAAAQHLRKAGGAIVNMASHAGVDGPPNMLAYAASKFAVIGMTQTAAKDLAPHGIRVNALSPSLIGPGFMWTRQTELQAGVGSQYFDADPKVVEQQMINLVPLRRLGRLEEVANGVAFLMSDEASYITGFNLDITGGQ
ncbi:MULTISPECIES: SDR family NAD(P)-dependent oxidoreductase [Cyanophyceae]|uniref:SDR family NAD(P)-dependent oxidoreductase n=1 Tax=Cyanophyceae TaxID=3028117 RepID=UPI0016838C8B|nr:MULTISPECIES: SDR family NAD(P)-dependent oxidoreductase [Cyanophyceae]MBD1914574.1 SDR family oxidoreductase [Phormidium sp. FACHB-77]MBD2030298.1 SDR family oxidoreductase [Phormidium sp. FACHB-322]MBD2049844.1 SDR family oxidoreductase [Leptolyngbya sp. FACHB-60]